VQRKAQLRDAERSRDLDARYAAERERRPRAAFGAGRSEAVDRCACQDSERRLAQSEVLVDDAELGLVLDHAVARKPAEHADADHREQSAKLAARQ